MLTTQESTTVGAVADEHGVPRRLSGEEFKRRRDALGLGRSELAARAGVDRSRVKMLEEDDPRLRDNTVGAIDRALSDLEREMGMNEPGVVALGDPADDLVEFSVEGNFGVRAVVKGPVRDIDALREAVAKLISDMNRDTPNG